MQPAGEVRVRRVGGEVLERQHSDRGARRAGCYRTWLQPVSDSEDAGQHDRGERRCPRSPERQSPEAPRRQHGVRRGARRRRHRWHAGAWLGRRLRPGLGHFASPDPVDPDEDLAVGFEVEFLAETPHVRVRRPDRVGPIAHRGQRVHVPEHQVRVVRIVLHGPGPPAGGLVPRPGVFGRGGQLLERLPVLPRQASALPIQPALELRCLIHVEPVEQRTGVGRHCVPVPAGAHRLRERGDVGDDNGRIESQEVADRWDGPRADRLTDGAERVAQAVPRVGFIALRPEQCDEALPRAAEVATHGEHRQERLGPALGQWGCRGPSLTLQREASKHAESEHADS
jgi:hypothetical protein